MNISAPQNARFSTFIRRLWRFSVRVFVVFVASVLVFIDCDTTGESLSPEVKKSIKTHMLI